jgi:hypothetical protein
MVDEGEEDDLSNCVMLAFSQKLKIKFVVVIFRRNVTAKIKESIEKNR